MKWLAIDLGSTNTKCMLLANESAVREKAIKTPVNIAQGKRFELDAETCFRQAESLLSELYTEETAGVFISTQMHGYILTDEKFCPVTNYVSWRDELGRSVVDELQNRLGKNAVRPSGVWFKPNLALCSLAARMLAGETYPANTRFCTLGGYLIGRLTGEHVCHMTNAAPTGFADIGGGGWNSALIEQSGAGRLFFPRIETELKPVGHWRGLPVYPDLGDQQACAYGDAAREGVLHISFGTAGLIGAITPEWGDGEYENRPWVENGRYLRTVTGLPGGRHLQQLNDEIRKNNALTESDVWHIMNTLGQPEASNALPDPASRPAERAGALIRTAFEDIAESYACAAIKLGLPLREVVFSGGGIEKTPALRNRIAQKLNLTDTGSTSGIVPGMLAVAQTIKERNKWN